MAETLTPTLLPNNKRRVSISARLQSPTSPFFLGSNDDKLERAQARAARAAAVRRKPLDLINDHPSDSPSDASYLDGDQIMELFRNCIKLASENKINQKNTWDLKLIDHLSEIIKVEAEDDTETNFQKASCTLEAGVKIYALRVDSVHSEAYKVLGGISRAGFEDHQETPIEGGNEGEENCINQSKKDQERKLSPSSTLESSYDALNVKKFDVAFAVDPLYHQTTAQFDEGGAKGLLLNNLGVYGGCRVLFDSQEVPAKCISSSTNDDTSSNLIDISFASEYIEQLVTNAKTKKEICPTFSAIVELLDESSLQQRKSHINQELSFDENDAVDDMAGCKGSPEFTSMVDGDNVGDVVLDDDSYDHAPVWSCDNEGSNVDTVFNVGEHNIHNDYEEGDLFVPNDRDMDDRFANVVPSLFGINGIPSSQNAWAGPDFWKYRRSKGVETVATQDNEIANTAKKTKSKKAPEADLEFTESLKEDLPNLFAPPKNPKSLLLPSKKVACSNKLPEDCHYQPEDLVKLFLLPHLMCLGKRRRRTTDNGPWKGGNDYDASFPDWDNGSTCSGQENDGYAHSDVEEPDMLVSKPRQVNKVEVQYDKTAKQVDVHLLKETLWDHLTVSAQEPKVVHKDSISFKQILSTFPEDCGAAAPQDISPHLCFICLLHLANEHGLRIQGCSDLVDLSIHLPSSS